jgi:hypothetical protein
MHTTTASENQTQSAELLIKDNELARTAFLQKHGISPDAISMVGHDAARRRCFRMPKGNDTVIMIDSVPDDHPYAIPGHKIGDFVRISRYLSDIDVNVPKIYDVDAVNGFLLLEDFGDDHFKTAAQRQNDNEFYYGLATDLLCHIRDRCTEAQLKEMVLPSFYDSHVHKGRCRIVDWYLPLIRASHNEDGLTQDYLSVWGDIEAGLPPCPQGFCHIDFHFENLMWMPKESGLDRCGVLDFQGAMAGPAMYDIANLLEDARLRIDDGLRKQMLDRYCEGMSAEQREAFDAWYRVIATQFHCRVIGQFIRLTVLDGKSKYLDYIPLLQSYLTEALDHPLLLPLKSWFQSHSLELTRSFRVELSSFQDYIRTDAF